MTPKTNGPLHFCKVH